MEDHALHAASGPPHDASGIRHCTPPADWQLACCAVTARQASGSRLSAIESRCKLPMSVSITRRPRMGECRIRQERLCKGSRMSRRLAVPSASISGASYLHRPTNDITHAAVRYLLCVFHKAPQREASALDFCGCPQPAGERPCKLRAVAQSSEPQPSAFNMTARLGPVFSRLRSTCDHPLTMAPAPARWGAQACSGWLARSYLICTSCEASRGKLNSKLRSQQRRRSRPLTGRRRLDQPAHALHNFMIGTNLHLWRRKTAPGLWRLS